MRNNKNCFALLYAHYRDKSEVFLKDWRKLNGGLGRAILSLLARSDGDAQDGQEYDEIALAEIEKEHGVFIKHMLPLLPPFERLQALCDMRGMRSRLMDEPMTGGKMLWLIEPPSFLFLPNPHCVEMPFSADVELMAAALSLPISFIKKMFPEVVL